MVMSITEMDTDSGLAIGILVVTFGLGLLCMVTILCRARCLADEQEAIPQEVQEADDYILISQETLQPQ